MDKIVITYPSKFDGELEQIIKVLANENIRLHLRKPGATEKEYEELLKEIPVTFHSRIVLHDFYHLQDKYAVGGLHFSTKNRALAESQHANGSKSTSCHSIDELKEIEGKFEYAFLSPIFPSISKQGYAGNLDMEEVKRYLQTSRQTKAIALGGIDASKIPLLKEWGFDGEAQLGSIWKI